MGMKRWLSRHNNEIADVNISRCVEFLFLIMKTKGSGPKPLTYTEKIPIYLQAALKIHRKPMTNHELVLATGFHANTITKYMKALVKSGIVKTVPQKTPRYVIAEAKEGGT